MFLGPQVKQECPGTPCVRRAAWLEVALLLAWLPISKLAGWFGWEGRLDIDPTKDPALQCTTYLLHCSNCRCRGAVMVQRRGDTLR